MKDPARLRFVRSLPCAKCGKHGQSEAHHPTGAGMALKDDDSRAFPLCKGPDGCHASLHNPWMKGPFKGWKKSALKLWQRAMADLYSTAVHGQEEGQGGPLQGEEGHDVDPWGEVF